MVQEVEAPKIYGMSHDVNIVCSGLLPPVLQQISLVLISVRDSVDPKAT